MSQLKAIKTRIQSIESTKKITAAMKLVSSSYFKRAETALKDALPFTQSLTNTIDTILHNKTVKEFPLIRGGKGKHHTLILVAGNRGLCGGFNMNIGRLANTEIVRLQKEGCTVSLVCFGEKAQLGLKKDYKSLVVKHITPTDKDPWVYAATIMEDVIKNLLSGTADQCSFIYTAFQSMLLSTVKSHQVLPYTHSLLENNKNFRTDKTKTPPLLFGVEPNYTALLKRTAQMHLKSQLYFAMLESRASEESARMVAMDGATKNSEDMLTKLYVTYNRNRQATITRELIEIIAGAESI